MPSRVGRWRLRRYAASSMQMQGQPEDRTAADGMLFVGLCSLAIGICYADRANIADAIIPISLELGWRASEQGATLSSFFLGYGATQIIGGKLADRHGGKNVLTSAVLLWSLATLLTPTAAKTGLGPMIAARVLLGAGEGPAFPAVHSMISRAVPSAQQSTAVGAITAASYLGSLAAFSISPYLIRTFSWESVFLLFGALGLAFLPVWIALPRNRVGDAPPAPAVEGSWDDTFSELGHLMMKKEVLAIVVAQYTQSWGLYGLLNWLPSYIEQEFGVQVSDLAYFTALPYLLQGAVGLASGVIADRWIATGMPVRRCRQLMQGVGMVMPAVALCGAAAYAQSAQDATILLSFGLGASALTLAGVSVSIACPGERDCA